MEIVQKLRWVIVVAIALFILVLLGWGLSSIARSVFSESATTSDAVEEVPSLEGVRSARYIVDGPVVASADHRSYEIEVTESVALMRVYSDYGSKVIDEMSYQNNEPAFDTFIKSLEEANAAARYATTDIDDDLADQGVCPTGRRYILELDDDIRRWTTSCDRSEGTAAGKMTTMRGLFQKQIPDFNDLVRDTGLNRR